MTSGCLVSCTPCYTVIGKASSDQPEAQVCPGSGACSKNVWRCQGTLSNSLLIEHPQHAALKWQGHSRWDYELGIILGKAMFSQHCQLRWGDRLGKSWWGQKMFKKFCSLCPWFAPAQSRGNTLIFLLAQRTDFKWLRVAMAVVRVPGTGDCLLQHQGWRAYWFLRTVAFCFWLFLFGFTPTC